MKSLLYGVAMVAVVSFGAVETASAYGPKKGVVAHAGAHHGHGSAHSGHHQQHHVVRPSYHNYHQTHGVRFSHGTYFRGNSFQHFRSRHWNSRYRCWTFYYPGTNCWYYWANGSYYPMSYVAMQPPVGALPTGIDQLPVDQGTPDQTLPPDQQLPPQQFQNQQPPQQFQNQQLPPQQFQNQQFPNQPQ